MTGSDDPSGRVAEEKLLRSPSSREAYLRRTEGRLPLAVQAELPRWRRAEVASWSMWLVRRSLPIDLMTNSDLIGSDLVDDSGGRTTPVRRRAAIAARRRRRWGEEASLAAVALGATGGFLALARVITGERGNAFDRSVVQTFGRARHPMSNALARAITFFGGVPGAVFVSLAALAAVRNRPRQAWQVVAGSLGGISAELFIKRIFRRRRPTILAHLEEVGSFSFPSGHSMAASSIYLTLAFVQSRGDALRTRRRTMLVGAGALAGAVGVSRVYLGVHWPTDVLGGLALGTAWACAAEAIFELVEADRIEATPALD